MNILGTKCVDVCDASENTTCVVRTKTNYGEGGIACWNSKTCQTGTVLLFSKIFIFVNLDLIESLRV